MSVTVGFSQATTSLIVPAPGTTRPDGTPADGSTDGGGDANLFAALLAMLIPGAQPTAETEASAAAPAVAAPNAILPPADAPPSAATAEAPAPPDLTDLQKSEQGKALLKAFTDALKAARSALDEGKPLDPALEKKLKETVDAVAAWFAGQPQLQVETVDIGQLGERAGAGNILPASPTGDLPDVPPPADAAADAPAETPDTTIPTPVNANQPTEKSMLAQIVPAKLAELGSALKDFAAQLEETSPALARSLAGLADRISVGDISDDVMARLGLDRSLGSTSPELDQLVAALTARPDTKPTAAAPQSPIAAPVLDLPEVLAAATATAAAPEVKKAPVPQPEAIRPEAPTSIAEATKPEPLLRSTAIDLDTEANLETRPASASDDQPSDSKAPTPAPASTKPADTPAPVAATNDASAQVAQAAAASAATATRAIHAAYAAPVQQLNVPQVAFEVARQFEAGNTRFQIRLDPADLGRIDVKLDLDKHGTVSAHMFVERPETLDLMMRDQRALQQALQQAGLDSSKTSLEFSLRQNPFAGGDMGQGGGNGQPGFGPFGTPVPDESAELQAQTLYRGSASASGVNLFV